jgi:hypothetical protein
MSDLSALSINAQHFMCCICTELVLDNRECGVCHKLFCFECIHKWFYSENKKSCPMCKTEPLRLEHDFSHNIFAQMTINSTEITCPQSGCNARISFGDLKDHLQNRCVYTVIKCACNEFGCKWTGLRSEMKDHLQKCPFQQCVQYLQLSKAQLEWKNKQYKQSMAEILALKTLLERLKREFSIYSSWLFVYVATEDDFKANCSTDLVVFNSITPFLVHKSNPYCYLEQMIEQKYNLGYDDDYRLWKFEKRVNGTQRPYVIMNNSDYKSKSNVSHMNLFLEWIFPNGSFSLQKPVSISNQSSKTIIIFLKVYEPKLLQVRYLTKVEVEKRDKLYSLVSIGNRLLQLPQNTELWIFEEVKPDMIEFMNLEESFEKAQILNGDILVFQQPFLSDAPSTSSDTITYPDIQTFYKEYMRHNLQPSPVNIEE